MHASSYGLGFECDHCAHWTKTATGAKRHEAKCALRGGTINGHTVTVTATRDASGPYTSIRCSCASGQEGLRLLDTYGTAKGIEYVHALLSLHRSTGASLLDVANGDA